MADQQRHSRTWLKIQGFLSFILHILLIFVVFYICTKKSRLEAQDTAQHTFLTTIGFHVLMGQALFSKFPQCGLTNLVSYRNKARFHGILQIFGGLMVLLGAANWQGILGPVATGMVGCTLLIGVFNFLNLDFAHKVDSLMKINYRLHLFGVLTFTLCLVAYRTILFHKWTALSVAIIPMYLITMLVYLNLRKYRNRRG